MRLRLGRLREECEVGLGSVTNWTIITVSWIHERTDEQKLYFSLLSLKYHIEKIRMKILYVKISLF